MAGGPFGLNGPQMLDPMELLRMRVVDPNGQPASAPPPQAPVPAASPPVAAPSSPAAPPAESGPSAGGGGMGINGIGSAISRALSGEGLFGSASPDDQELDPLTGAPRGLSRRANMQSLMKVGMLLMAAGQPQSADSRARILSGMAGATDDANNQINNFARNRLEMAKTKLLERQQIQEEAANTALMASAGIATGAPAAAPGTIAPPAPIAPGATPGTPAPVPGPAVAGGGVPVDPATPAAPTPETGAGGAGTPVPATGQTPSGPSLAPLPPWRADAQQAAIIAATPLNQKATKIAEFRRQYETQPRTSAPYRIPGVGTVVDTYEGNNKAGVQKLSDDPVFTRTVPSRAIPGALEIQTVDAAGNVIKTDIERDVRADKADDRLMESATKEGDELKKTLREVAEPSVRAYDKLFDMQKTVLQGGSFTGPLAQVKTKALRWISEFAVLKPDDIKALVESGRINSELGAEAGKFAKENYGPQVSDQDRKNAQELLGAIQTGTKEEIAGAIQRLRETHRAKIEGFNRHRDDYEGRVGTIRNFNTDYYVPKRIDKKFDDEAEAAIAPGATTAAPAAAPAPAKPAIPELKDLPPVPDSLKDDPDLWRYMTDEQRKVFGK